MEWTAAQDAELRKLYEKRLSIAFIATWMRREGTDVRQRLQVLGLSKSKAAAVAAAAAAMLDGDDDPEDDFPMRRGRHKGHLLSDEAIGALYRRAGRNYAGPLR